MAKVTSGCLKLIDKLPESVGSAGWTELDDHIFKLKEECLKTAGQKTHRRSGPLSPKQQAWRQKFKSAAATCKGKPGYRQCVGAQLKK